MVKEREGLEEGDVGYHYHSILRYSFAFVPHNQHQ